MSEQSRDYYARRADEELLAAGQATDERAAQSHRELAARYRKFARGEETPRPERSSDRSFSISDDFRILP